MTRLIGEKKLLTSILFERGYGLLLIKFYLDSSQNSSISEKKEEFMTSIEAGLQEARHILPDQGPIGVFVHHNTLHAFQHLHFSKGVETGAKLLNARPYPELSFFLDSLQQNRILPEDLEAEVREELHEKFDEILPLGLYRGALWCELLINSFDLQSSLELNFHYQSLTDRDKESLDLIKNQIQKLDLNLGQEKEALTYFKILGVDLDPILNPEVIRYCAAFLDKGQATITMPNRNEGFFIAVGKLVSCGIESKNFPGVRNDFQRWLKNKTPPLQVIQECLNRLHVNNQDTQDFILRSLLSLPGWAGMFSRMEYHPHEAPPHIPVSLIDFLAVRLAFESRAIERIAKRKNIEFSWSNSSKNQQTLSTPSGLGIAFLVFSISKLLNIQKSDLSEWANSLTKDQLQFILKECQVFNEIERRRIFLQAYERHYREQILPAIAEATLRNKKTDPRKKTEAQFIFCIDEREESIRRALEELNPFYETFGVAGFFGFAVNYQGLEDSIPAPYCPAVIKPAHKVKEVVRQEDQLMYFRRQQRLERINWLERKTQFQSRTFWGGFYSSFLLGPFAALLSAIRILAPRQTLKSIQGLLHYIARPPKTELTSIKGEHHGFTVEEAAERIHTLLSNIGLTHSGTDSHFAPIIVLLGHGSTSLNNPHESAHDCGACGGRRGGANARLFADLANHPDVRAVISQKGIQIPVNTWFIGALHDTADDRITLYDTDKIPGNLLEFYSEVEQSLEIARRDNARERARRFENAPLTLTPEESLNHVENRASHFGQPRPEYGHCTNSICIVGRRSISKNLHLDRRAFLVSYDPTIDPHGKIIERILAAVGPVGAGINLEYYFSAVDNEVFGCGTKLPHNVTGLIGVMNGHQSDLRTGLPKQMVEIHEPMRLLVIVEAAPETLLQVTERQPEVKQLVVNEWIQLVSLHPKTQEMKIWRQGMWQTYTAREINLPQVEKSEDWHLTTRKHLSPAWIQKGNQP